MCFDGGPPFAQNTFLVVCADGSGLLFDPGAATARALSAAEERGVEIAALLLTHAHVDHIEGVAAAKAATGAPIHLHPLDRPLYDHAAEFAAALGVHCEQPPPPDVELSAGERLAFGGTEFDVVFTPGHAPGHVIFVSTSHSTSQPAAITGDVIFQGSIGRTDLPGGSYDVLMESIRSSVLTLPPETVLHPGHGPAATVAAESATNPFLR